MDDIEKLLKDHPACESYTNTLLGKLGDSTGFHAGSIRDIIARFREEGEIFTQGRVQTTGGGTTGSGRGYPSIDLTYGVKSQDTAVTLLHEMLHWAGIRQMSGNQWTDDFTDEVLAKTWNQMGVVMSVDEYRSTYPAHSAASAKASPSGSDYAASTLAGNAQFIVCLDQWDSGYTTKYVGKPKP